MVLGDKQSLIRITKGQREKFHKEAIPFTGKINPILSRKGLAL